VTTVFIAMNIDFIAMKTVVTTYDHGNSRQRRRSSRRWRRSSWESSAHLTAERREKSFGEIGIQINFVRKYSILRKLRFITLSGYLQSDRQYKTYI